MLRTGRELLLKKTLADYRKGAAGSMIDEYERALGELKALLSEAGAEDYSRIVDAETRDEDCRSIETIMDHVVGSGYAYAGYLREALSMNSEPRERKRIDRAEIGGELDKMLAYTTEIFEGRWETVDDETSNIQIKTRWGGTYDLESLLEHAIVHVLRHRRQIEKFLIILKG